MASAASAPFAGSRRAFSAVLFLATTLPLVAALGIPGTLSLETVFSVIAILHVPMTLYLLFDAEIRAMMRRHPVQLVLIPVGFFAAGILTYTWIAKLLPSGENTLLVYALVAIVAWQSWHFGKQNVGVYSLMRIAQRLDRMEGQERRLNAAGAVLGIVSAYVYAPQLIKGYAPKGDFSNFLWPLDGIRAAATVAQIALIGACVWYICRNRHRLTCTSASVLLFGANFFALYYFVEISWPALLACTTAGHGAQYMAFLAFHAVGYRSSRVQGYGMIAIFVACVAVVAELYYFHFWLPDAWIGTQIARLFGFGEGGGLSLGLVNGILLSHFWFDSVIWRLKNPSSRAWVAQRYSFLFDR